MEKRWVDKKKEVSAEIQLHEMVANLDLLSEIKEDGLVVKDEIVRLKEMEKTSRPLLIWQLLRIGRSRVLIVLKFPKTRSSMMRLRTHQSEKKLALRLSCVFFFIVSVSSLILCS